MDNKGTMGTAARESMSSKDDQNAYPFVKASHNWLRAHRAGFVLELPLCGAARSTIGSTIRRDT